MSYPQTFPLSDQEIDVLPIEEESLASFDCDAPPLSLTGWPGDANPPRLNRIGVVLLCCCISLIELLLLGGKHLRPLLAAVRFLTRLPMPGPETQAEDLASAVGFFPLVGALVGAAIAGIFVALSYVWSPSIAAVLAVAAGLLLTGGFHEDGLTDSADGLGGAWTREDVLNIMKDSRIGAYGAMTLWCVLTLRWACLVEAGTRAWLILPFAMAWGRWSIAFVLRLLQPISSSGLAQEVHQQGGKKSLVLSTAFLLAACFLAWKWAMPHFITAVGAGLGMSLLWTLYLKQRMDGHSGDLLGASATLVEAAVLVTALMK